MGRISVSSLKIYADPAQGFDLRIDVGEGNGNIGFGYKNGNNGNKWVFYHNGSQLDESGSLGGLLASCSKGIIVIDTTVNNTSLKLDGFCDAVLRLLSDYAPIKHFENAPLSDGYTVDYNSIFDLIQIKKDGKVVLPSRDAAWLAGDFGSDMLAGYNTTSDLTKNGYSIPPLCDVVDGIVKNLGEVGKGRFKVSSLSAN